MVIEDIHEIDLTPELEIEIAAVIEAAFGSNGGYAGRSYFKQRHSLRVIARVGGALVGHIALVFREICVGDRHIPIMGVAEVATDPRFQGQGIASALLKHAIERSQRTQARFLLLFGVRPIYAGHGFQEARNDLTWVAMQDMRTVGTETRPARAFLYLPLSDERWDNHAPIDLLGPTF